MRTCYMLRAPDRISALRQAERLGDAGRLAHIPDAGTTRVRAATRRETAMFDCFLSTLARANLKTHSREDADGLTARRRDAVERFFILLYHAPADVKARYGAFDPKPSAEPAGTSSGDDRANDQANEIPPADGQTSEKDTPAPAQPSDILDAMDGISDTPEDASLPLDLG